MLHTNKITRPLPPPAVEWPASHTYDFFRTHVPQSVFDILLLAARHVKALA